MVTKCATKFPTGKENMSDHPHPLRRALQNLVCVLVVVGGGG